MEIKEIYTFGSPRVLSPEATAYAETSLLPGRIFRHVQVGDAMCDVPAKELSEEAYDHAGLVAVVGETEELAFGPRPWADAKARLRGLRDDLGAWSPAAVEAHYMSRYNALIYEQFRRNPLPRSNGWDPSVALVCARASRLVYKGAVQEVLPLLGFHKAHMVASPGIEALLVLPVQTETLPYGVVAFCGTWPANLKNPDLWRQALSTWQSQSEGEREPWYPGAPGSAQAGWLREVAEIEAKLGNAIRRFLTGLPIVVTGHSKGAAQGLLWALRSTEKRSVGRRARGSAAAPSSVHGTDSRDLPTGLPRKPRAHSGKNRRQPVSFPVVGARVRALRESFGLTQAELAHAIDDHPSHISRLEKGERIHLEQLFAIAAAIDVSIADFFDESLTYGDVRMVEEFRELSAPQRRTVFNLIQFKLGKDKH